MKKQKNIILVVLFIALLIVAIGELILQKQPSLNLKEVLDRSAIIPKSVSPTLAPAISSQVISIDFGDGKKISDEVMAQTAFGALQKLASGKNYEIEFKEYKYGLIVEKIGEKKNSAEFAWMYFVNGKAAQIAADRYVVYPGDKIEWKYEKMKN